MLDESLYRLYVSYIMFHSACKNIHSFIRCQIEDDNEHAFACDTIRACRLWLWKAVLIFFYHVHLSQFPQPFFISVSFVYFLWSACLFFSCYLQLLLRILPHFALVIYMDGQNLFRCCSSLFRFDLCDFFIVIILQSILVLLNHSKFEVLIFKMTS